MKTGKKLLSVLLAVVLMLSLGISALADNSTLNEGSIEVMNPLEGETYTASKIFDVTFDGKKYAYSISADSPWIDAVTAYANASDTTDADGLTLTAAANNTVYNVSFDSNKFSAPDFAKAMVDANVTDNGAKTLTKTANDTVKVEGLELGYWIVLPSNGTLASLTTTDLNVQVYDKNEVPEVKKEITGDAGDKQIAEANIGDTVPFTLTTKVPDMTGYSKYFFVVKDNMDASLTLIDKANESDTTHTGIVVTLDGTTLTEGTDYDVDITGTTSIRIIFKDMLQYQEDNVGDAIVITYSAVLNQDAVIDTGDKASNDNEAVVEFSNDPSVSPTGTPDPTDPTDPGNPDDPDDPDYEWPDDKKPTGEGPKSKTETHTAELNILKKDQKGNIVTGAEFTLTSSDAMNIVKVTGDNFVPYETPATGEAPTKYYKLIDGTYTTEEPIWVATSDLEANYGLYENPDPDAQTCDEYMKETATWYETEASTPETAKAFVDSTGKVTFSGLGAGTYTLTESVVPDGYNGVDPITVTIVFDDAAETFYIKELAEDTDEDGDLDDGFTMDMTVVNNTGAELPTTGGMGTTLFYVLGSLLIVGAAVLLITRKRMSSCAE